ncbi:MAG TPA: glycosyltransferase family 2 protein [Patescibacteria group bacterium]|nr:glycosyltransferase family 2 protein [Patescibacteria group bacterium]
MATLPKILVIILSWNRKKDTLETLASLSKSIVKGFTLEILVVDNASTDGTPDKIKKLYPKVHIIINYKNLGFAEGNNIGMKYGLKNGFDYIALLNDDTVVDSNLIKKIFEEHQKNKKAGAISPKIYFAEGFEFHKNRYKESDKGNVIWYAGGVIDWKNIYGSNNGVDEVDRGQFNETQETDFTTGCFVMYKEKVLEKVGLYDKQYFAYMEDMDHAQRIKMSGWKVLYSPKGYLWHKVSQSSSIGSELNDYYLTRNRMIFGLKYATLRTKQALIRESFRLLISGRKWQKIGIRDYYLGKLGKGSWK